MSGSTAVLVAGDFVQTGGMDIANFALASFLARRQWRVHLVTHRADPSLAAQPNIRIHHVPKPLHSYFAGGPLLERAGRKVASLLAPLGARVVVNGANCEWADVNWVHYVNAVYKPTTQCGWLRRMKLRLDHPFQVRRERRIVGKAQTVIANSERTRRDLIVHLGVPENRIRTVYYGIEAQRFALDLNEVERRKRCESLHLPTDRPLVVFVGGLGDRRKGFATTFAAWRDLCARSDWPANLVVIGAGAELKLWIERAQTAGMASRIHFLGFRQDVPAIMAACHALVAPTMYEAYGIGVQEALACGLPAFVSRGSGVAEQYTDLLSDLLLTDFEDPTELRECLLRWHRNPEHYRTAVRPLTQAIRQRNWDDMAGEIAAILEEHT